jgi:hypothetical protein
MKKSLTDPGAEVKTLIPTVQDGEGKAFSGIYTYGALPKRIFSESGRFLLFSSADRSELKVLQLSKHFVPHIDLFRQTL